jgi:hypothetical protein
MLVTGFPAARTATTPAAMATPVAPPVSAIAASTTTAVTSAATPSAAATIRPAAPGAFGLRTRFVHVQRAAAELRSIERRNRPFSLGFIRHFHERETTGPARIAIGFNADPLNLAVRFK